MTAAAPVRSKGKRALDLVGAAVLLVLLGPAMAAIAAAVAIVDGRPVLFAQPRPGLDGRVFLIYKFRTMRPGDGDDAARVTRLGRLLRRTSLDELPELWNVLKGEMSLVGPRPLLVEYLDHYTPAQARRHLVRPGLTGLAQVEGRNALTWDEKFVLDARYVDEWSLLLDIRILTRTVAAVMSRRGISHAEHATMPPFTTGPTG